MRILFNMGGDGGGYDDGMGGEGAETAEAPETSREGDNQSFYLPQTFPGRENYKSGDTITLKVIGEDQDGDLEVKCVHGKGGKPDWKTDLRESVPETPGP